MMTRTLSHRTRLLASTAAVILIGMASPVMAEDAAPAVDPSAIKVTGMIDTGATFTDNAAKNTGVNYGHLFTDKHDQMVLNQAMLTANRDLDPKAEGYDWGFKTQAFYGSDARYAHLLGMWDRNTSSRNQWTVTELNVLGHAPWLTEGGIDVKAGIFSSPLGSEVIQASGNYLYSHSYIFNFGVPYLHTGVLTTTHATSMVDVYAGFDTGNQTTFGERGDENHGNAFIAGLGLNLMEGKLAILGLAHVGPELPSSRTNGLRGADDHARQFYDVTATYKATDNLTFVSEGNFVKDDLQHAKAWAFAQYGVYKMNSWLSLVGRGEVFVDSNHNFVSAYPGNRDFVNTQRGDNTDRAVLTPAIRAVYSEFTVGANISLPNMPERLEGTMLRPEMRFDRTLNGAKVYDDMTRDKQWGVGMDLVVPVSIF